MKTSRCIVLSVIMTVALLLVGMVSSLFLKNLEESHAETSTASVPAEALFGIDGLPAGQLLQTQPIEITDEYIIFSDRVLQIFSIAGEDISSGASKMSNAMTFVPDGVNRYLLVMPTRIVFESDAFPDLAADVLTAIDNTYSRMPSYVVTVDAVAKMKAHTGEYLFYRTGCSVTATGAYYAAEAYSEIAGVSLSPLSDYDENRFLSYAGDLRSFMQPDSLVNTPDYCAYYLKKEMTNHQTITALQESGEYITYESPAVSQARMGTDIFVGGYFSHTIIDGDAGNGKILLIVGDDFAKPFAVWMVGCYDRIVLVDPRYYNGSDADFMQLFDDYEVTDFLVLENAQNLGESILNHRFCNLLTGSTPK